VHHSDAGTQYTSIRYSTRLLDAGALASIGSVGDSFDNALAESVIGLFKTGAIRRRGLWRNIEDVEVSTPAAYYRSRKTPAMVVGLM